VDKPGSLHAHPWLHAGTQQGTSRQGAALSAAAAPPPRPLEMAELTISDAVLCSEMGVHFSPCGRYLAACVACQVDSVCI
jgi:hypothetical protein